MQERLWLINNIFAATTFFDAIKSVGKIVFYAKVKKKNTFQRNFTELCIDQ
jgi:hypothetical protein